MYQDSSHVSLAVLVPCYNEEAAVTQVIEGFHSALPKATMYVYNNNSGDRTAGLARAAGAVVRGEIHRARVTWC